MHLAGIVAIITAIWGYINRPGKGATDMAEDGAAGHKHGAVLMHMIWTVLTTLIASAVTWIALEVISNSAKIAKIETQVSAIRADQDRFELTAQRQLSNLNILMIEHSSNPPELHRDHVWPMERSEPQWPGQ